MGMVGNKQPLPALNGGQQKAVTGPYIDLNGLPR